MLLLTTKKDNAPRGHQHVVYLPIDAQRQVVRAESRTSKDKKHYHDVVFVQPEPVLDPMTGQAAQEPGYWEILEADGHTHDLLGAVPVQEDKEGMADDERAAYCRDLWKYAKDYESDAREKAKKSWDMYTGDQWDEKDKNKLEGSDRACLTINVIESSIDLLSGYQRQNRTDIQLLPTEEGDSRAADILTEVVRNVCERNEAQYVETEVFKDGTVGGRGVFHCYVDNDDNIEGEIVLEQYKWDDAYFGPHEKMDLSDCEYLAKSKWYSKDKIKQLWPDMAEEIQRDFDAYMEKDEDGFHQRVEGAQYRQGEGTELSHTPDLDIVDIANKEYRLIEVEKKEYQRIPILVNAADDFYFKAEGWSKQYINAVKDIPGFNVIYRKRFDIRRSLVAGDLVLEDDVLDEDTFSLIPFYAKKYENEWWGKVESAKDVQKEVNKRHSQAIDILNKAAAYGWFYYEETFPSKHDEENFKKYSTKPGFMAKVTKKGNEPTQVEGVKMPAEVVNLMQNSLVMLREVMHVNPELLGSATKVESGVAMLEQKKQGLIGNDYLFDNLSFAKKQLGKRLVKLIQAIYTPERMVRILTNRNQKQPVEVGGQPVEEYPEEALVAILKNVDLTKYDVVVSESTHSPTQMLHNYAMMVEMARGGLPVPPQLVIESSPMPAEQKQKMLQAFAAQQQSAAEEQQATYDMELDKTLLSSAQDPQQAMYLRQLIQQQRQQGQMPQQGA